MEHMLILLECRAFDNMLIFFQSSRVISGDVFFGDFLNWTQFLCTSVVSTHGGDLYTGKSERGKYTLKIDNPKNPKNKS